jgi:tetrapyrrole methylase family protein/MazG family protein
MSSAELAPPGSGRIVVVGLGPGNPAQVTVEATAAIAAIPTRFVRTWRHPSASVVGEATSFDDVYDVAGTIEDVYTTIVERLVAAARDHGVVLYAVPGSPLVAERTVELLRETEGVDVDIQASLSFLDLAWARLGIDPVAAGVRLVDGHRFELEAAGVTGPMLVAQADTALVLSQIKLAVDDGPDVVVLQRLGLDDEVVRTLPWHELDREVAADHLTSVWVPPLRDPVGAELVRLDELVRTLRQRCPWDRAQTHRSLTRHLLEETYEVLEAIDGLGGDDDAATTVGAGYDHLEEELGDLLFQVFLHATLAAEAGQFTVADVARGIHDKLVARHPHVFAGADPGDPDTFDASWEQRKQVEKGRRSVMDGIPGDLPALLLAFKMQRKAEVIGFEDRAGDAPTAMADSRGALADSRGALADSRGAEADSRGATAVSVLALAEAVGVLAEVVDRTPGPPPVGGDLRLVDAMGQVFFDAVAVSRHLDIDPEAALHSAAMSFRRRVVEAEGVRLGWEASGTVSPTSNTSHITTT